ncbi:SGNH/GDSL hydrolase family protein [Candidatus Pelagibacter sp.]|nr:SGNH/GDSL hydrolase family protein [Candidatus Pelagibacter sp.]
MKLFKKNFKNTLLVFISLFFSLLILEIFLHKFDYKFFKKKIREYNYEFIANYKYNKEGYRDEEFFKDEKKIILIGDSFVFGSAVDEPYTIDKFLEKKYLDKNNKKINIFNLGVPGADINDYLNILKKNISSSVEKIFIFIYVDNDIYSNFGKDSLKMNIIKYIDNLKFLNLLSSNLIKDRITNLDFYDDYQINEKYKKIFQSKLANPYLLSLKYRGNFSDYYNQMFVWFKNSEKENLKKIIEISNQNKSELIFVLIPSKFQVKLEYQTLPKKEFEYKFDTNKVVNNNVQIAMIEWFKEKNVNIVDLLPVLKKSKKLNYYIIDDHFNKFGNELTSETLIEFLN